MSWEGALSVRIWTATLARGLVEDLKLVALGCGRETLTLACVFVELLSFGAL